MSFPAKKPQNYDYMVKVVIVGDSAVGKTNILLRQVNQQYKMLHTSTIGVDFKIKTVLAEDKRVKMQVWDTAGQQRYKNMTATYYKGASGVILAYSIIDRKSFVNVESWLKQITQSQPEEIPKIIVGNKCDCTQNERQVTYQEGRQFAERYGLKFIECSAKINENIQELFQTIASDINQKKSSQQQESNMKIEKPYNNRKRLPCEC